MEGKATDWNIGLGWMLESVRWPQTPRTNTENLNSPEGKAEWVKQGHDDLNQDRCSLKVG